MNRMLYNEPSPLETKVLTRRFGLPNSRVASIPISRPTATRRFEKAAGDDARSRSSTK